MLSWRLTRRASSLPVAAALTFGILMPVPAHAVGTEASGGARGQVAAPSAPSVKLKSTKVPAAAPTAAAPRSSTPGRSGDVVAELPQTSISKFRLIGVTWAPGRASGVTVEVRTRTSGTWSSWTSLDVENDEGDSADGGVPGTEPRWIGNADGVAARVSSKVGVPQDVRIATIDPGANDSTGDATASSAGFSGPLDGVARTSTVATSTATTADGTPSFTPKPTIITRSQWGASAGTSCDSPLTGDRTRGVVVHHTAGSNSYSQADSKAIVRATQAYHMKSRQWCDIGYNFLVDKYGQIFEGRRGGVDRAVRAAHSGNLAVNTYDMGVSMMGDFENARLSPALQTAMVKLVGWRLGTTFLRAKGLYTLGGLTLNMIAGHRNVVGTECPGRYGYAWLSQSGGLRDRVEKYMSRYSSPVKTLYKSLGASRTGAIYIGEAVTSSGRKLRAKYVDVFYRSGLGAFYTSGLFRTEHNRVGAQGGSLGFPRGAATSTRQRFATGTIFLVTRSGTTKPYSVAGAIAEMYTRLGESSGRLGSLTVSSRTIGSGVTRADFAKGYIISTKSTGRTVAYTSSGSVISTRSESTGLPAVTGVAAKPTSPTATITWSAATGAKSYDVCLVTATTSAACARSSTGLTSRTATFRSLTPTDGTDYYAKVRARDGSKSGPWSALRGFNLIAQTPATDTVTVPSTRKIAFTGHGFGHGIGMSQYGAQRAAISGVTFDKILSRYYPGTAIGTKAGNIRVLLSQATSSSVSITGQRGLVFRNMSTNKATSLPTIVRGTSVNRWRIIVTPDRKTQSTLQYRTGTRWSTYNSTRWTGDGQFEGPTSIALIMPNGSVMKYRGAIRSALPSKGSTTRDTVDVLPIESYVRGVVAAEMPSSWKPEALKAQAVAARTYGVRSITSSRYYDICSTTACQVYGGVARETTTTNAAVTATRGKIVTYRGAPAFTQFSSSSGGWTATGSQPYLKAVSDPYDNWSGNPNHTWKATITAAAIEKAYPAIGTLARMKITRRSGVGEWGGRVTTLNLYGSKKSITVTGNDVRFAIGLKSTWFSF
ncbi:SpoIID/LytB domain-containing protein [Aeromicrobium sp.]|uniref:SpoIID/LytB domain-containing protein n=1 Tax=Aeromicrobium sp. TaxID=1871063 RepID=UPI00198D70BE|nr:SpoIID/LytB domain-containing protein [Aeromicrobium sp.]MBC7630810.1 SpoIID/LytB domain-containing protein [Aeromicrobium sp.]